MLTNTYDKYRLKINALKFIILVLLKFTYFLKYRRVTMTVVKTN